MVIKFIVIIAVYSNGGVSTSTYENEYLSEDQCLKLTSMAAEELTSTNRDVEVKYTCVIR